MAQLVSELSRRPASPETSLAPRQQETSGDDHARQPLEFSCPECHGVLWEVDQPGGTPRFECSVGHRVSAESLLELRLDEVEGALWASVRALEELGSLALRHRHRAATREDPLTAERFRRRAEEATRQAAVIRALALQPRSDSAAIVDVGGAREGQDAGAADTSPPLSTVKPRSSATLGGGGSTSWYPRPRTVSSNPPAGPSLRRRRDT